MINGVQVPFAKRGCTEMEKKDLDLRRMLLKVKDH